MQWWIVTTRSNPLPRVVNDPTLAQLTNVVSVAGPFPSRAEAMKSMPGQSGGTRPIKGRPKKKGKPPGPSGALIVNIARTWLGVPYQFGGTTRRGVDCSGLTMNVAHEAGITSCPRTSEEQWAWVEKIPYSEVGAGDLVFFVGAEIDPPPGHVSIIVSKGRVISADTTGTVVREESYDPNGTGIGRVIGYGRMPGVGFSSTANPSLADKAGRGGAAAQAVATSVGGIVVTIMILLLVVLLFAALFLVALKFKG